MNDIIIRSIKVFDESGNVVLEKHVNIAIKYNDRLELSWRIMRTVGDESNGTFDKWIDEL